jgi:hypothetical protein
MEWFLAKLVYRFQALPDAAITHFDEQLRLIQAEDELHAFHKAQQIGQQEQQAESNPIPNQITWQFIDVTELYKLNKMIDGAEILSQLLETTDAKSYQRDVRLKAGYLLANCTDKFLQAL